MPDPFDVEKERAQRFFVTRPFGYLMGAAIVLPLGFLWDFPRAIWLAIGMAVVAATSLAGRRGDRVRWIAFWLSLDATWVAVVIAVLGVHPLSAALLFVGHAVTGYLTLPRSWARRLAIYITGVIAILTIVQFAPPEQLTPTRLLATEAVMAAFGLAAVFMDLELIVRGIRQTVAQREIDLERATKVAEEREAALRSVSHEVRNPLTSIQGFAHFLTEVDLPETDRMEFARRIETEAAHLTHLVDDLLAGARLDAGQLVLHICPVEILESAREVAGVFEPRGLDVEIDIDPAHMAQADAARLGQILRNLFSNAEKYGGAAARVSSRLEGENLVLTVHDRGPGVSVSDRELIFQDFTQSGLASHLTGTGLGLGISRRLAKAMGGDLRCIDVDTGACFELVLPAYA